MHKNSCGALHPPSDRALIGQLDGGAQVPRGSQGNVVAVGEGEHALLFFYLYLLAGLSQYRPPIFPVLGYASGVWLRSTSMWPVA
jgi:hypothetical protein